MAPVLATATQLCNSTGDMQQESLDSKPNKILQVGFWLQPCLPWQVSQFPRSLHYELFESRKLHREVGPEQTPQMPHSTLLT